MTCGTRNSILRMALSGFKTAVLAQLACTYPIVNALSCSFSINRHPRYRFHQIHCLTSFRKALQTAREGNEIGIDFHDDEHWPHCLWYMRQAILCFADDTLEMPMKVNGSNIITGQDDLHQCRDSGKLYALREKRGIWKEP